jgi:UDP-glucose 4-epimerase
MKKALLTGGTGFVGVHLIRELIAAGYEVHVLARPSLERSNPHDKAQVVVHEADLTDRVGVSTALNAAAPDYVFHLATSPLMSGKTADAKTLIAVNVEGSVNVMNAAAEAEVAAFINMGSFSEYGPKQHPVAEDERCDPVEPYAVTKLAATLYGQGLARRGLLPCVTFRLFTPYGPGIQPGRLVRNLIEKVRAGEDIPLTKPSISRDFVYVEDIPRLLIEGAEKISAGVGQIFNLGTGTPTTLEALLRIVEKEIGIQANPKWGAAPVQSYDSELWQANMEKTFSTFAWRPKTQLLEGIQKTIQAL